MQSKSEQKLDNALINEIIYLYTFFLGFTLFFWKKNGLGKVVLGGLKFLPILEPLPVLGRHGALHFLEVCDFVL